MMSGRWIAVALFMMFNFTVNACALDINTATQAQLEQVKGIGVALSERLLAARAEARFADWQDLIARVAGIAPRTAQRLSDQGLTVADQPFAPTPRAAAR